MGSKSQTSTSSTAPNPQAMQLYQNLLTQAQGVAATPYQAYGGQLVAPVNQQQGAGIANINQYAGAAQPAIQTAEGMATQAASPITQAQIQGYMSPYTQDVVNATQAQFNNQNAQQMQGVKGNAIAQGALGGNREAIAESETANQQQLAQAPVIANLQNQGYQTGLSTALSQQQAEAAGAYSLGNLGVAGQNAGLTGAGAQVGAGTLQQGTQQAQDVAAYQQFMNQQAYPFQTTQWLAGLGTGVGSQMGGTSSTTSPGPSLLGQIMGGVAGGAGILGSSGAFGSAATATAPATAGWLSGLGSSLAAAIPFLARGGGVANREVTIPETPQTLMAQQHQLVQGHRRAQLFPHGTSELPVPHGMARATTEAGAIHYNPHHLTAETVHHLASGGRLNELLDLGPVTKEEALRRIHEGEHPVAIVERNEQGHEVRAALGTHLTALDQLHAMHKTKSPGHTITLEHPDHVVAKRIEHHLGGGVANRDMGGGVNYQTFGGGFGTPVMPYSGSKSWIPNMGIVHGPGAPRPPSAPGQQQSDLAGQMKNIGSMASSISAGLKQNNLGIDGLGSTADPSWTGGDPLAGGTAIGMGGIGSAKRGGGISNYADGGTPSFDDRFTGVDPGVIPPTIDGVPTQLMLGNGGFDGSAATPASGVLPPKINGVPTAPVQPSSGFTDDASVSPPASEGVVPATPASYSPEGGASPSQPRGMRNNNPGNIEDGSFARSQPGYKGSDGRFATFETPEAGANASGNLLGAYGAKGIDTLSGIINRWAPAADNNNTNAYIAAVSKMTGLDPNQHLDMTDPAVRTKVASAIHQYENGTGGTSGNVLAAHNYNRASGLAPTDSASLPAKADLVQSTPANQGVANHGFNIDLGANSKLWPALMSAGFGMMASRSPFAGVAIGEGGQEGLRTYQTLKQQEQQQAFTKSRIDLEAQKLSQEADHWSKDYAAKMMPYSGVMTTAEKLSAANQNAKLAELTRQHDLALHTPVKWSEDRSGNVTYALPRPNANGGVDFYPIDPITKEVARVPAGSAPTALGGQQPNSPSPPGSVTQTGAPATQEGFTPVAAMTLEQAKEAAPPPEVRAALPAGSPDARNEEYLKAVARSNGPQYAADLKAIASYQMNPAQLFSMRKNMRANAMGDLFIYDPTYDQRRYNQTNRAITGWAQSPEGRATRSLSVVVEHLGTLEDLGNALQNGNVQALNGMRNTLKEQFGYSGPPSFDAAKQIVFDEVAKAVIGGTNAESDRAGLQASVKRASSPEQLEGVIHTFKELMGGQVLGLQKTYETATGLHNFEDWLTPRARLEVSKTMADRDAKLRSQTLPGAPGAAPAAPAAQRQLTPADQSALAWANANASDPRAAAIRQRLGSQ